MDMKRIWQLVLCFVLYLGFVSCSGESERVAKLEGEVAMLRSQLSLIHILAERGEKLAVYGNAGTDTLFARGLYDCMVQFHAIKVASGE